MLVFWLSALVVVGSTVAYHICQKSIPPAANPMLSVFVTLLTATTVTFLYLAFTLAPGSVAQELRKLNWASVTLGLTIVGIDAGYLLFYRSGWSLSFGAVFCSALVGVLLLPLGVLLFREKLLVSNTIGVFLALVGLYLITRK